jgi:hypothetical protein
MPTALCEKIFSGPVGCRRPRKKAARRIVSEDLEFSEYARSPRIPAAWYLAPMLLVMPVVLTCCLLF